jgi:hypothetical protein
MDFQFSLDKSITSVKNLKQTTLYHIDQYYTARKLVLGYRGLTFKIPNTGCKCYGNDIIQKGVHVQVHNYVIDYCNTCLYFENMRFFFGKDVHTNGWGTTVFSNYWSVFHSAYEMPLYF